MNEPDPTSGITNPHDALFRGVFGDPERAAELLRSALPRKIRKAIDWTTLRRIDASFVDEELRDSHADLLFTARLGNGVVLLYIVLEHKSAGDRFTVFQLLRYVVRIWERWRAENPSATHLPPVLPVVLHHGSQPWNAPRHLHDLIQFDGIGPELAALQPAFTFALDDLAASDGPGLEQRQLTVQSLLPLLHLQQLRRDVATAALLLAWRHLHLRLLALPGGQPLVNRLVSYVAAVSNDDPQRLRVSYARISKATEEQFMTTAEKLRQEGRQEGLAQRREVLITLIEQRFGHLPPHAATRVTTATAQEVDLWMSRILAAATIDDLLT